MAAAEVPALRSGLEADEIVPGVSLFVSRSLVYLSLLLLAAAATWAVLAHVDVVVSVHGELSVMGEPVALTGPEEGLVVELPVTVGTHVAAGDVILRLQSVRPAADAAQLEAEARALDAEAARHEAAAKATRAAQSLVRTELDNAEAALRIVEAQQGTVHALVADGIASALQSQDKEREVIDARARVLSLRADLGRGEDDAAERGRQAAEVRARISGLLARLAERKETEGQMTLVAPVAGTITQLLVRHPGSVIDTDQPAVVISPDAQPLLAALTIPNASMRTLRVGDPVRMRFDAFPYQDFGDVEGWLVQVEPAPDGNGSFRAWASLDRVNGRRGLSLAALRAGLRFEADIVLERRRIIDFVLKPLRGTGRPITVPE